MINNLVQGTPDDYPCNCIHNNIANGSITKVTPDLKYADLITCGRCNFKWYSNKEGMFDYGPCPRCNSTGPIMAELNQARLAQGSNTRDKINQLQRVLDFPFTEVPNKTPPGPIKANNRRK